MALLYNCVQYETNENCQLNATRVSHWSCSFYKALDVLQLHEGRNKVLLNRDDQAGFRLDTTFTDNGRGVLSENVETTTKVDYVNSYSSVLQTTSYQIMESKTTL
jgi:hypothetical protein